MWLSSTAQQAIHAVLCIAGAADEGPVRVDEIAAVLECPRNYLSKTLHVLARTGVLRSGRGPKGGFQLALPANRLTLAQVIAPFEPVGQKRCLLGLPTCGGANPCAAHERWSKVAGRVDEFFARTTIETVLRGNPGATSRARDQIRSVRLPRPPHPRSSHGSRT
jgi:Rrf2 family protein